MVDILQGGVRDQVDSDSSGAINNFAVTNITEAFSMNCDAEAGALAVADTLATLIRVLIRKGIINGTVA